MKATASFRLFGDERLTAAAVTGRLGIHPRSTYEVGNLVSRGRKPRRTESLWLLSTARLGDGVELSEQFERLLEMLVPLSDRLWDLVSTGYRANWLCYVDAYSTVCAVKFDRELLARIAVLPGDLEVHIVGR